jgi:hypothetical protein
VKTGELYFEQVLVGSLVAAIGLLPWLPELRDTVKMTDTTALVAAGSIAVAVAFWIGIPFDRLADTLSTRLDQHNRLRFALKRGQPVETADNGVGDAFPEDRFRILVTREGEGPLGWIDYHRSRIRLTRALAVYGPGLTVALSLGLLRAADPKAIPSTAVSVCVFGIAIGYVLWAVLASLGATLPRTNEPEIKAYAKRWRAVDEDARRFREPQSAELAVWSSEWQTLAVPLVLSIVALWLAARTQNAAVFMAALAGIGFTSLSAWAWWRISLTYRTYLDDFARFRTPGSSKEQGQQSAQN